MRVASLRQNRRSKHEERADSHSGKLMVHRSIFQGLYRNAITAALKVTPHSAAATFIRQHTTALFAKLHGRLQH
jgi:hypothetical protein